MFLTDSYLAGGSSIAPSVAVHWLSVQQWVQHGQSSFSQSADSRRGSVRHNDEGTLSVKSFPSKRPSVSSVGSSPSILGIQPFSSLSSTRSVLSWVRKASAVGRLPEKAFACKSSRWRLVSLPSQVGRGPVRRLLLLIRSQLYSSTVDTRIR